MIFVFFASLFLCKTKYLTNYSGSIDHIGPKSENNQENKEKSPNSEHFY